MTTTIAPIAALLFSIALLLMGNGLQGVLLPVRGGIEEFSALQLGVLGGSYFLGFAVGCVRGPRLVRRVGHIRVFAAMVAVASAVAVALPLVISPLAWWILRAVTGYCFAVLYMVIESWLNERSTPQTRGLVFSLYTIINLTVITVGQMLMPLGDPAGLALFSIVSILISVAAVPVSLSRAAAPAPIRSVKIDLRRLYRASPVGFVACLTVGIANGSFWSLAPIFAQSLGASVTGVAIFMSTTVIMGALGQWPLGRASDRTDRRKIIILATLGSSIAGLGLGVLQGYGDIVIYGSAWVFGFFALPLYALAVAHTNDHVNPDEYVETASGLLLLYAIGAVIGPMAASGVMAVIGAGGLFVFTAACHLALAFFAVWRMARRAPAPAADRADFADSIRLAQTVAPMDPTAEEESFQAPAEPPPPPDDLEEEPEAELYTYTDKRGRSR